MTDTDRIPNKPAYFTHPSSYVQTNQIGDGTRIWAFVNIMDDVEIGSGCNICDHCFIESGVRIGNDVTIKCGIYLWAGVHLEDRVFVGPNVVFTNDVRPRSRVHFPPVATVIRYGASIGANSTILAGVTVGRYAMTGIASVVTRDVPNYALVFGNPARIRGWVDEDGVAMTATCDPEIFVSSTGKPFRLTDVGLQPPEHVK